MITTFAGRDERPEGTPGFLWVRTPDLAAAGRKAWGFSVARRRPASRIGQPEVTRWPRVWARSPPPPEDLGRRTGILRFNE